MAQSPWVVGELSVDYPPFHLALGEGRRGIYADLMQEVLHRAHIPHRTRYFTFKRLKRAYKKGTAAFHCCTHPDWWQDVGGIDQTLFSIPLLEIRDIWVFPRGYSFDPATDLDGKRVALVRAFGYRGVDEQQIRRQDYDDAGQLLMAVDQHQADAGIVNEWVLFWEMRKRAHALDLPIEQDRVSVHLLVSEEARDLLPKINKTIKELIADGTVDQIILSYLPDYRPVGLSESVDSVGTRSN